MNDSSKQQKSRDGPAATSQQSTWPISTEKDRKVKDPAFMTPHEAQEHRSQSLRRKSEQKAERELNSVKGDYRRRYLSAPGTTDEQFEREWPSLLAQHQREVAAGTDTSKAKNPLADPGKWGLPH